jgi:T-complex protein 1 subunit eta
LAHSCFNHFGFQQPTVVLLKEGTDSSQGVPQLLSNIAACLAIAETLSSTLGPRGMDKLIVNERGDAQITNDGATILKLLDIVHPAAKTLVDIARAQDAEVGDGTTSVVLLAAQLLKEVRGSIEEGVSPHIIMKGFRNASQRVSLPSLTRSAQNLTLFIGCGQNQGDSDHSRQVRS